MGGVSSQIRPQKHRGSMRTPDKATLWKILCKLSPRRGSSSSTAVLKGRDGGGEKKSKASGSSENWEERSIMPSTRRTNATANSNTELPSRKMQMLTTRRICRIVTWLSRRDLCVRITPCPDLIHEALEFLGAVRFGIIGTPGFLSRRHDI